MDESQKPVGKLANIAWGALTVAARENREAEAQAHVDRVNNDTSSPHTMGWRWGYRGIEFFITINGKHSGRK